jgi:hypothetical protein
MDRDLLILILRLLVAIAEEQLWVEPPLQKLIDESKDFLDTWVEPDLRLKWKL